MYDEFKVEIANLLAWMKRSGVSETSSSLWCITRLPVAYREFERTYESRYAADIATHQHGALARFAKELGSNGKSELEELRNRLEALNERFRLPALGLPEQPPAPKQPARKRKPSAA
jgi:hypothetical protein